MQNLKTRSVKAEEADQDWWVISAEGVPLGRLAARIAAVLRGKHKASFTPNTNSGDFVVVTDAEKILLTGAKLVDKKYYRHSGYPHGLKEEQAGHLLARRPTELVTRAVRGMLPHTALGRAQMRKLKVYVGGEHPHAAQEPKQLAL